MNKRIELFIRLMMEDEKLRDRHRWGKGSSREAFKLGDLIIKLPRNFFGDDEDFGYYDEEEDEESQQDDVSEYGILQSNKEIDVWEGCNALERRLLATIHCWGHINGYPYIVMEEVAVAEDIELWGCNDNMGEIARDKGFRIMKNYQRIMYRLCDRYNLKDGDFFENDGNYGVTKDKRVVLCDYGFCGWSKSEYEIA